MKRRITLSIMLALCVVYGLQRSSDSTVTAQRPQRYFFDTGIIPLDNDGETEIAVTVATGAGDDAVTIAFRRLAYAEIGCSDGVCRQAVSSQSQSAPIVLAAGEAGSLSVQGNHIGTDGTRVVVLSSSPNVTVNAAIINTVTGALITMISAPNQSSKLD
jgi:DNA-binding beta-propeller fold protein YncE